MLTEREKMFESWFESGLMDCITKRKAKNLHKILKSGEYHNMSEKEKEKIRNDIKYLFK